MLPVMPKPEKIDRADWVRLNVSIDPELHKELLRLSVETGEKLTVLVPRLLRAAMKAEKERLNLV